MEECGALDKRKKDRQMDLHVDDGNVTVDDKNFFAGLGEINLFQGGTAPAFRKTPYGKKNFYYNFFLYI